MILSHLSHLLVDLGWVDFDLGVPPSCPPAQPLLRNSHQPRQNWADSDVYLTDNLNVLESVLRNQMDLAVLHAQLLSAMLVQGDPSPR